MNAQLLYGCDLIVTQWVLERIPHVSDFGPCAAVGIAVGPRIVGGVVYHSYDERAGSMQISMAADSPVWAKKEFIAALLSFPFVQNKCWSIFTLTPEENEKALKVNRHIGISRKTVIPHIFGKKKHGVFCQMTKPEFERRYG